MVDMKLEQLQSILDQNFLTGKESFFHGPMNYLDILKPRQYKAGISWGRGVFYVTTIAGNTTSRLLKADGQVYIFPISVEEPVFLDFDSRYIEDADSMPQELLKWLI
jgi:hypothetical protein